MTETETGAPAEQAEAGAAPDKHPELSSIHDFAGKLMQPDLLPRLKEYVEWQVELRRARREGRSIDQLVEDLPDRAPVSINLDVTTSCNFRCDHCIDMDILNTGIRYDHDRLLDGLSRLADRGLRSVILIGGGEPTIYPRFQEVVHHLKDRDVSVSVVSNGSGNAKILDVCDRFDENDWVRLSLDSGTDETFQAMHKPRKAITLQEICKGVPPIKERNPDFPFGFSFIVTWKGAHINEADIVENIHEIETAAELARDHRFDYIAIKPFLVRAPDNNAEIVGLKGAKTAQEEFDETVLRIRAAVNRAKEKFETDDFRVYETTNLKVLEAGTYGNYTEQPKTCHMQFFRQVISPLGLYNCPVYRNQPHGRLNDKHGYSDDEQAAETRKGLVNLLENFDASSECREVTCLYNHVNWFIEDLIEHPEKLDSLEPAPLTGDTFL